MKKILLAKNFYQYQFPPYPGKHFGFNVYVLVNALEALLIDTGFEEHAAAVQSDLTALGITPSKIIISHFHDDHFMGLKALPQLQIFSCDLDTAHLPRQFQPTDIISDTSSLQFGDFHLRFMTVSGHAACGLYTIINEQFVHVGDDIMCSNTGAPILPYFERKRIQEYIASLEKLKTYKSYTLLLGHGSPISGEVNILADIDNRLNYVKAVSQSQSRLSYEDATKDCFHEFLHKEWHEYLYQ
jgi:glyoxylase-like metal-dependent hydrolase (beta-lactamase superfamily II)